MQPITRLLISIDQMIFAPRGGYLRPGERAQSSQMIICPSSTHSVTDLGHAWVSGEPMIEPVGKKLRANIFRLATAEARVMWLSCSGISIL